MQNIKDTNQQNTISNKLSALEKTYTGKKWIHYFTIVLLIVLILFSIVNVLNPHFFWTHFEFIDYPLHSTIETLGAIAAILMAFLPIDLLFKKPKPSYTFISYGFFSMGIWDLFHSLLKVNTQFVFTHSIALLTGGFFFALIVFPWKQEVFRKKKVLLSIIGLVMILAAIVSALNTSLVPKMIEDGTFTSTTKQINFFAGVLFFIATIKLIQIYLIHRNIGELILIFVTALSAIAGIIFQYSDAWTDNWWIWHIIRLIAYSVILAYLFWRVQNLSKEKSLILEKIAKQTDQLNAREEQFKVVFEDSPLGKSMTGIDGSLKTNKAFTEITGYSHEELKVKNWKEITHPDDIKESEEITQELLAGKKQNAKFEKRYLHKKGHYIWTEVNTTLHKNTEGDPLFFITAISDITQRKEIEHSIKVSEQKFRELFNNDPTAIFITDPTTGLLVDVNPAAERLMEISREELIGMNQNQLYHEDVKKEQARRFKSIQIDPELSIDSEIITRSGIRKPVEIRESIIEINNKPHVFGIFHDVSEIVQKQKELKESEEKHRAIFESATDAFIIASLDSKIVEVNPTACHLYGYSYDEMIGKNAMDLIHPDYHTMFVQFKESIEKKGSYEGSTVDVRKNGSTFLTEVHGTIISFNKQPHLLAVIRDITEEQQAKESILASERKFKNLFNSVSIPLCYVKEDGQIESTNNRFRQVLGYSRKDIPHLDDWWKMAYPDPKYREWVMNNWNKVVQKSIEDGTDIKSDIYDVTCKDGSIKKMIIAGITIENDVLVTFIDVTKEKETEQKILEERDFSDAVINSMPGVFYLFGQNGKFIKWNKLMADTAGIPIKKMAEKTPMDIIAPEDHKKVQEAIQTVFTEGEVFVEADFNTKGKKNIPFYFTGKRIILDDTPYLVGLGIDISKRKEAEKDREKVLIDLQERMKEITCLFNINNAIRNPKTSINEVMQSICNFIPPGWQYPENTSTEIVLDKKIYKSKNYNESEHAIMEKIMLNDVERGYVKVNVKDLNKEQLKNPFLKEEKKLLESIAANISIYISRVEYEIELTRTADNLARSNKELEQFAYVASHDLQEPLRMVSSYTQLIERKYKGQLDERADKYIHYAVDGATRMQNLINDLLDFSRVSTKGETFNKTSTKEILDEAILNLTMYIQENKVKITHDKLPVIKADKSQLERVFYNLIYNAIKFRKVEVNPEIHISALKKDGKWLFSVQDNGIGIEEKFKEKVFVIFQRLHGGDKYKGTGIGLALCKRIVNRHGGDIWFESKPNQGTTFYFTINKNNLK